MPHNFKPGDRALFVYEEDLMDGIVQDAYEKEIKIQFEGVSCPSIVEADHLQYVFEED